MRKHKVTLLDLPGRASARIVCRASSALAVCAFALAGCDATEVPVLRPGQLSSHGESGSAYSGPTCMIGVMYIVAGDQFTLRGAQLQVIGPHGNGGAVGGGGDGATAFFNVDGYDGAASFRFDNQLVHRFVIDKKFILSGETEVLAYQDPDGDLYEYHLYATTKCSGLPSGEAVQTRSEIAALES